MTGSPLRYGPGSGLPGPLVVAGIALGIAVCLAAPPAAAQEIRVTGNSCAASVHLVARNAHLTQVLARLAQALGFELRFDARSDPVVTVDAKGTATQLLAHLAPAANVSMTQASNPACPQRQRIVNLWVLQDSDGSSTRVAAARQPEDRRPLNEQDGYSLILRSHGVAQPEGTGTEPKP